MKQQTSNVPRSTFNVQPESALPRVNEVSDGDRSYEYDLEDRLLEFTARVIGLVESLPDTRAENHIAGQPLRSATSPFGNHGEAQAAESRRDFLHKLGICLKELKETKRWLRLVHRLAIAEASRVRELLGELDQLIRIFAASIATAEKNAA